MNRRPLIHLIMLRLWLPFVVWLALLTGPISSAFAHPLDMTDAPSSAAASTHDDQQDDGTGHMSLTDLGYNDDLVLRGARGETTIAFPLPEGGISGGQISLQLSASPVLNDHSTIQVLFNDQPVAHV